MFKLQNGTKVPYHYIGENEELFHSDYAFSGPLRITAMGHFDESAVLKKVEISQTVRLQSELNFE
jgi:hypothetical protein